jgi:hypothetical protein
MKHVQHLTRGLLGAAFALSLWACQGPAGADGTSCAVKDNGDGTSTVTCGDTVATIKNGNNGTNGQNGTNGTNGQNGTNGTNGSNGTNGTNGTSCSAVNDADAGTKTITCSDGTSFTVSNGTNGTNGSNGTNGVDVSITNHHGAAYLAAQDLATAGKYIANVTVTSATAATDGTAIVNFKVAQADGGGVAGLAGSVTSFTIAKLSPGTRLADAGVDEIATRWEPYVYRKETVVDAGTGPYLNGAYPNAPGYATDEAYRETGSASTVVDHGDGTYTYTFTKKLGVYAKPVAGTVISYERNKLHRVAVMVGGHAGPTGDAVFDFVPDGTTAALASRDIVPTASCQECHGKEFAAHGGDRMKVETCVTCHAPGSNDAQSGNTLDLKVMVHKIHAGGELPGIAGPDGLVFDNPATPVNEAADNGEYAIWGYGNAKVQWSGLEFPAGLSNCTKCHQGTGANAQSWNQTPSRAACGSCHADIDWTLPKTATNGHPGGAQSGDGNCMTCHDDSLAKSVTTAHDFTGAGADPRNVPEFIPTLTVSNPANGQYFVKGEQPIVTVTVAFPDGGVPDHTLFTKVAAYGCTPVAGACPPVDATKIATSSLYVSGPRAYRVPVGTAAARATVYSTTDAGVTGFPAGGIDLSATGSKFVVTFDNGEDVWGSDKTASGPNLALVSIAGPGASATGFANTAAATAAETVAWLNGNAAFAARGIAWVNPAGAVAIRSRNYGRLPAVQLSAVVPGTTTATLDPKFAIPPISGYPLTLQTGGGITLAKNFPTATPTSNSDPAVTASAGSITYKLDPVDDLKPGSYVVDLEFTAGGRFSDTVYRTPTVAKTTFQVGTPVVEKLVADNCNSCHQAGTTTDPTKYLGQVLDFARHDKHFDNNATDQCGSCHDYVPGSATGTLATFGGWGGGYPISRRVHALHNGAALTYPNLTVGHAEEAAKLGRNWAVEFPRNIGQCEACHSSNSSGTWKTNASRIACGSCHDTDSATNHIKAMTWDPTPAAPFSGDEGESCKACH